VKCCRVFVDPSINILFDHFGFLSPIYDHLIRPKDPSNILELLDLPKNGRLLDAGGGTGRIGSTLTPFISQVVIADISFGMLRQAQRKDGLSSICAPTEKLPFPDNTFDRITLVDALHHVENALSTIMELWRVTKPGGKILIEEPDIRTLPVKLIAVFEKAFLMRSHFISPLKISSMFDFSNSKRTVKTQDYTSWILVEKPR
jgi:ubiquinone/menaquinone biosynthesis C-methylase UbiE